MHRSALSSSVDGDEGLPNRNTEWVNGRGTWVAYLVILSTLRVILGLLFDDASQAWTVLNVGHAVVTFFLFHWIKGVPFSGIWSAQGAWDDLTMWEQVDMGRQYTPSRKFFTIVPILLYLITLHYTNYEVSYFVVNTAAFIPILVAKLAPMHKVRIFGINK